MRMVQFLTVLILAGCGRGSQSKVQQQISREESKINLVKQAQSMIAAIKSNDTDSFLEYVHPVVIAKSGGRAKFAEVLKNIKKELAENGPGFEIVDAKCDEPEKLVGDHEQFAIARMKTIMSIKSGGKMAQPSYLICHSQDGGVSWKFIDGAGIKEDRAILLKLLPNFPDVLELPKWESFKILGSKD
jgi:hypothetical protein